MLQNFHNIFSPVLGPFATIHRKGQHDAQNKLFYLFLRLNFLQQDPGLWIHVIGPDILFW